MLTAKSAITRQDCNGADQGCQLEKLTKSIVDSAGDTTIGTTDKNVIAMRCAVGCSRIRFIGAKLSGDLHLDINKEIANLMDNVPKEPATERELRRIAGQKLITEKGLRELTENDLAREKRLRAEVAKQLAEEKELKERAEQKLDEEKRLRELAENDLAEEKRLRESAEQRLAAQEPAQRQLRALGEVTQQLARLDPDMLTGLTMLRLRR